MPQRTYWLDLFTGKTWEEFIAAGSNVSGFRESRWKTVQRISPGDYLLCYVTGVSRFIGVLEATSEPFQDDEPIWRDEDFPCRIRVKPIITVDKEHAVPVKSLRDRLSCFQEMKSPNSWTGSFRGSPAKWTAPDGEAVVGALVDAQSNPVMRDIDEKKWSRRPRALQSKDLGLVTIPDADDSAEELQNEVSRSEQPLEDLPRPSAHEEIQWMLLKVANDMGLDVWVAKNDRGRSVNGRAFVDLPRLRSSLPLQFDRITMRTVELIDVLWLQQNAIVAAFEIESTTSIYSGLLRMADLVATQPNINIPLYIVAPDERRDKVLSEVNRPTFASLRPPLSKITSFIPFSALREKVSQIEAMDMVQYLKPEFISDISEECGLE